MLEAVEAATVAEDLFGPVTQDERAQRKAKRTHRVYANHLHPDRAAQFGIDAQRANDAFARLSSLYELWQKACTSGAHAAATAPSAPAKITLQSKTSAYVLGDLLAKGTVANLYRAESATGPVAVKMPRSAASSKFMENERTALTAIRDMATGDRAWLAPYYPKLVDQLSHRADGSAELRKVNVLDDLSRDAGFVTLAEVQEALPSGLDGRDWAWIHRRLLMALAGAHLAGLVHGAVLPENVLIHPEGHGVVLAGWSFAAQPGGKLEGRVQSRADHYPPEAADGTVSPETDIYMAHALMLAMLAPGERRQRAFAKGCMQAEPRMRPDAPSLLREYDDLLEDLYGKRRFRVFPYAPTAARKTA